MVLTRELKATGQARARTESVFMEALLKEAVDAMLADDVDLGKAMLRDSINATIGFKGLGVCTNKPAKSLMRMFSPAGNPQARNLFEIISHIQRREDIRLQVQAVRRCAYRVAATADARETR